VITEYGVADLYGKTIRQRAEALINITHPKFRDKLKAEAKELNYI
jgi:acetyl-CoA hydrolase